MREPAERLRDILEAIAAADRYLGRGNETLERDELLQGWLVRNLQIIGEAARALPEKIRALAQRRRGRRSSACAMCSCTDIARSTPTSSGRQLPVAYRRRSRRSKAAAPTGARRAMNRMRGAALAARGKR